MEKGPKEVMCIIDGDGDMSMFTEDGVGIIETTALENQRAGKAGWSSAVFDMKTGKPVSSWAMSYENMQKLETPKKQKTKEEKDSQSQEGEQQVEQEEKSPEAKTLQEVEYQDDKLITISENQTQLINISDSKKLSLNNQFDIKGQKITVRKHKEGNGVDIFHEGKRIWRVELTNDGKHKTTNGNPRSGIKLLPDTNGTGDNDTIKLKIERKDAASIENDKEQTIMFSDGNVYTVQNYTEKAFSIKEGEGSDKEKLCIIADGKNVYTFSKDTAVGEIDVNGEFRELVLEKEKDGVITIREKKEKTEKAEKTEEAEEAEEAGETEEPEEAGEGTAELKEEEDPFETYDPEADLESRKSKNKNRDYQLIRDAREQHKGDPIKPNDKELRSRLVEGVRKLNKNMADGAHGFFVDGAKQITYIVQKEGDTINFLEGYKSTTSKNGFGTGEKQTPTGLFEIASLLNKGEARDNGKLGQIIKNWEYKDKDDDGSYVDALDASREPKIITTAIYLKGLEDSNTQAEGVAIHPTNIGGLLGETNQDKIKKGGSSGCVRVGLFAGLKMAYIAQKTEKTFIYISDKE